MLREAHPMKWQAAVVRDVYFRLPCQNPVAVTGCASERLMPNGFANKYYAAALSALNRFGHLLSPTIRPLFCLHFMPYNFTRIHRMLRITPAMAAGVAGHVWSLEDIVGLLDAADKKAA